MPVEPEHNHAAVFLPGYRGRSQNCLACRIEVWHEDEPEERGLLLAAYGAISRLQWARYWGDDKKAESEKAIAEALAILKKATKQIEEGLARDFSEIREGD